MLLNSKGGLGVSPPISILNFRSLKQHFLHFQDTFEQNIKVLILKLRLGEAPPPLPAPLTLPSEQGHQHRVLSSHGGPRPQPFVAYVSHSDGANPHWYKVPLQYM